MFNIDKQAMHRRITVIAIGVIILLIFIVIIGSPGLFSYSYTPSRPNIILITIDALRPDHLSCYGYKRVTSPNIDKLAKEGVLFTQAIAQAPVTPGSIPSLMSSTYPSTNGVIEFIENPVMLSVPTLPLILKNQGYTTASISGHGEIFASIPGLERGFDLVYDRLNKSGNEITNQALEWLDKNKTNVFFLWIHYFDTHGPYQPPPPYDKLFVSDKLNLSDIEVLRNTAKIIGVDPARTPHNMTEQEKKYYISQYDGEIKFVDEQIGRLLNILKEQDLLKNTLIILTADHGENLYDHENFFGHATLLYDELVRVPLIMRFDNLIPTVRVISQQVQLIDIMPTILDIAKVNTDIKMEGKSLLSLVLNKTIDSGSYAFSEARQDTGGGEKFIRYSIRSLEWKLIYTYDSDDSGKCELYDLNNDPQELHNLVQTEKEKFKFMKEKLESWKNRPRLKVGRKIKPLDQETLNRLKSLGYLQ